MPSKTDPRGYDRRTNPVGSKNVPVANADFHHVLSPLKEWLQENAGWLATVSVATLIAALIAVPIVVAKMRDDYFVIDPDESPKSFEKHHPVLRLVGLVLKNLVGGILVIAGILLSLPLVPGQGILTILIGLLVMDFPGKKRLELRIVRFRPVNRAITIIRKKAGRNPLILPEKSTG